MGKIKEKVFLIGLCFLFCINVFSQNKDVLDTLVVYSFDGFQNSKDLRILNQILYHKGQNKIIDSISLQSLPSRKTITNQLCLGFYNLYNQKSTSSSFAYFNEAYILSKGNKNDSFLKLCLLGFLELYSKEIIQSNTQFKTYLDEFELISKTKEDHAWLLYYTNFFNSTSIFRPEAYYESAKKLIPYIKKNKLSFALQACFYEDIGLYYNRIDKKDSARWYYKKVIELPNVPYIRVHKFNSHIDLAEINARNKNFSRTRQHLTEAIKFHDKADSLRSAFTLDRFKAVYFFENIPKYDSAYFYLKSSILKEQEIDYQKNSLQISELNVKLRTAEKEKEILKQQHTLREEKQAKKGIIIGAIILFSLGGIITYITYKNMKRKQLIAEQEKELEAQKVEKVLKDQELTIINAMIEGQEKERKELAEELHDNVASTLASANMQLDYFLKNKSRLKDADEILEKAASLIGNAYKDVHEMAHQKNSGVIAQKGLLPAIKDLAKNISITNKIQIDVKSSEVKTRINNTLEITIFRIIQELINNVVKHSNANEAIISITFYDGLLNLIIEDDGKGFDQSQISSGMGLESIEKRIEALEGSFEIDSVIRRGTTILIDIPIS